ncbi:MAG: hypothetical protein ACXVJN_09005 [Mucilaginibacter sp.]
MKPNLLLSCLSFLGTYSPLFVIIAIRDFDFDKIKLIHPYLIYPLLVVTAISIIAVLWILNGIKEKGIAIKPTDVGNKSPDLFNYSILYLICFFAVDPAKLGDLISMFFFLVIMLILTIKTNTVFLSPVLSLAGYKLYEITYKTSGIDYKKVVLGRTEVAINTEFNIFMISEQLYLIKKK